MMDLEPFAAIDEDIPPPEHPSDEEPTYRNGSRPKHRGYVPSHNTEPGRSSSAR